MTAAAIPALLAELIDGQDCDFTNTQWEKEWLADGKVCHCIACVAARKCISDITAVDTKTRYPCFFLTMPLPGSINVFHAMKCRKEYIKLLKR